MSREYFGCSFSGKLDSDFKVLWSTNRVLFKHLSMGSKMLLKRLTKLKPTEPYIHCFKSEGVEYCAKIIPLVEGGYSCDIHEKINEQELSRYELSEELEYIKQMSLDSLSLSQMILDYLKSSGFNTDYVHEYFKSQKEKLSSAYCGCHNIMKIFDAEENSEFIPLQNYILRSWDIVQGMTRKLKTGIGLEIDIFPTYVKLDYSKFELAFFNLVKILLMHSLYERELVISIKSTTVSKIEVSVEFTLNINNKISEHSFEMRAIKYLFRKLNGDFKFYADGRRMIAKGEINAETSCNANLVPEGRYIEVIDDPKIILNKRTSNRFIKLYDTVKNEIDLEFASDITELSDVNEDESVFIARLLFEGIDGIGEDEE